MGWRPEVLGQSSKAAAILLTDQFEKLCQESLADQLRWSMNETTAKGGCLLERIRVKGRDFDVGGKKTPEEELIRIGGLFRLKDVQARIPIIDAQRLKYWYSSEGPFRRSFVKITLGERRSLVYVDLQMLVAEFQSQGERCDP